MRRLLVTLCLFLSMPLFAQWAGDSSMQAEVHASLNILAGDSLKGRGNYSEGLSKAAAFIAGTWQRLGLASFPGFKDYYQPFAKKSAKRAAKDSLTGYSHSTTLLNVVGVIEGRSRRGEAVIFSAHYDHLGVVGKTVYNGANDNASGTTALLALAAYFSRRADNERTLIFCAFAGEELGLLGSYAFVPLVNKDSIVAVINLEMLGQTTVGKNSFFITGAPYSDLQDIIKRNLKGEAKVADDLYPEQDLFSRSDNFPFAQAGVPAHTITASDDTVPCYHGPCDDVKRLDIPNLARLVRLIAVGTQSIIDGRDTPSRIRDTDILKR